MKFFYVSATREETATALVISYCELLKKKGENRKMMNFRHLMCISLIEKRGRRPLSQRSEVD